MPIVDIQRQMVELGRIRTGDQVEFQDQTGKTKLRPRKLETFRLTSPSRLLIDAVAAAYGGQVSGWGEQWQVVVTTESLPIMLPPGQGLSQWYELWSGGGCQRRCDGLRQAIVDEPCACPADKGERRDLAAKGQACKPTTRLNVVLPELPGLGVWRLESHGYYAAVELAGTAEYLAMATAAGHRIPARLRLVKREMKRPATGRDGQPTIQTRKFAVPTIDLDMRIADLLAGEIPTISGRPVATPALPAGPVNRRERVARPALPSGTSLPEEANLARPGRPPLPEPPKIIEQPMSAPAADPAAIVRAQMAEAEPASAPQSAPVPPSDANCRWALGQGPGKPGLICGLPLADGKHSGDHGWIAIALSAGGRVMPPEQAA
jgi:hypothetical protein